MKRLTHQTLNILLIGLLFCIVTHFTPNTAIVWVERVLDGDTVLVKTKYSKKNFRVRLDLIDAPEIKQWNKNKTLLVGRLSQKWLLQHLQGKWVRLVWYRKDFYGRILGHIYCHNHHLNWFMVHQGYAFPYRFTRFRSPEEKQHFLWAFINAQQSLLGIFKMGMIQDPYLYRRKKRRAHAKFPP